MLETIRDLVIALAAFMAAMAAIIASTPPVFRVIKRTVKALWKASGVFAQVDAIDSRLTRHENDATRHSGE